MTVLCTYCSAAKDQNDDLLPAISRYQSERIIWVNNEALVMGLPFFILSGKYGLIHSETSIPYYDHLLHTHEVEMLSDKVGQQIITNKITHIIFYGRSINEDPALKNYYDCIALAVKKVGKLSKQELITLALNLVDLD